MPKVLVCYRSGNPASLEVAQAYKAAHPGAQLLALTTSGSSDAMVKTKFHEQVCKPIDMAVAGCTRPVIVLCYGLQWRVYNDGWTGLPQSLDSCLYHSLGNGGGYKGSWLPNQFFPQNMDWQAAGDGIRLSTEVRIVGRIDAATKAEAIGLITKARTLRQLGWETREAYIDTRSADRYARVGLRLLDRGWRLTTETTAWRRGYPTGTPSIYMQDGGAPAGARFDLATWPARGWMGMTVQSTGMVNLRSVSHWCAYMIRHGAVWTTGAVTEPTEFGITQPDVLYPMWLSGNYTWGECVLASMRCVPGPSASIGDPLSRIPAITR